MYIQDYHIVHDLICADSYSKLYRCNADISAQNIRDYLTALAFNRAGGRTNTADALRLAREDVFQSFRGDRNGVTNKVILLTDGGSNINSNLTPARAADLKVG